MSLVTIILRVCQRVEKKGRTMQSRVQQHMGRRSENILLPTIASLFLLSDMIKKRQGSGERK